MVIQYQWQHNATNIIGATNALLTLTNIDFSGAGTYTVNVANPLGSTSAAASLAVGYAPSITDLPESQSVVQGSNATFSVTASGTAPLSYQWYLFGVPLAQGTNSTLSLSNVQAAAAGWYSVAASNPFGSILSSNAVLTLNLPIVTQPQSEPAAIGSNITLSVAALPTVPILPLVSSGTLKVWLRADAGVVTNDAGQVSLWQDQSGNTNDAAQPEMVFQPTLRSAAALGSNHVVQFSGPDPSISDSYLIGDGPISVPTAITTFAVYDAFSIDRGGTFWSIGFGEEVYRGAKFYAGDLQFDSGDTNYTAPFTIPANTGRIRVDRLNTNMDTLNIFDSTAVTATNFTFPVSGLPKVPPQNGYFIGGATALAQNFNGDIAEWICYQGCLSDEDRVAVTDYLDQKYFRTHFANSVSYQWSFNGTNIAGATNASVTLTNVEFTNAGACAVSVSDPFGVATSSNVMVTVGYAPSITSQPQSQEVTQGAEVS